MSGTIPAIAGKVNADAAPLTASMPVIIQRSAWPLMTSAAAVPWVTAVSAWASCRTVVRDIRSETTPPTRRKSTIAAVRAVSTCASAPAESVRCSDREGQGHRRHRGTGRGDGAGGEVPGEPPLPQHADGLAPGHRSSSSRNAKTERFARRVPSVRGGRADSCINREASVSRSRTWSHTSGSTQRAASV